MSTKKEAAATNDWTDLLAGSAGAGLEDVTAQDLALPIFRLLQSLSPETKKSDSSYIAGASEGMILDVVGRAVYDSIVFVPSRFATHFVEWKSRKDGGGLVANHGSDRSVLSRCTKDPQTGKDITPEGHEIVQTATFYGIVVSGNVNGQDVQLNKQAIITLSGTQQKVARKWISDVASIKLTTKDGKMFTPPIFAMSYRLFSVPTKNDLGSWSLLSFDRYGWTLDFPAGKELFQSAKEFSEVAKDMQPAIEAPAQMKQLPSSSSYDHEVEIPF